MAARASGNGDWGPPPPWWIQQQERKKKEKGEHRQRGLALKCKEMQQPHCGDRVGNPYAKKPKRKVASPLVVHSLAVAATAGLSASQGMTAAPIPVEEGDGLECLKCGRVGHFWNMCDFKPLCVLCKEEGYTSMYCPTRGKTLALQTMGHAISGEGFYYLQFEEDEDEPTSSFVDGNRAVITAPPGKLSMRMLEAELHHLFEDKWDWKVEQLGDDMFLVVFLTADMLLMVTCSGKLYLSLNNVIADIQKSVLEEPKGEIVPEVWVKLSGVPPKHRHVDCLMAGPTMIGRPIAKDKLSLIRLGPVRMKFACREPAKLRGSVQLWFNGVGFTIKIESELLLPRRGGPPPSCP